MVTAAEIAQVSAMLETGRCQEAESRAQALVGRDANSGLAWKLFGVSLAMQGKAALQALQKAAELQPEDPEVHNNLCIALLRLGRHQQAVASGRRALAIKSDFAEAHNSLGNALRGLGQTEAAVASFRQALQLKPQYAQAYCNLGDALSALGQADNAIVSYRRALAIRPEYPQALNNLSYALLNLGHFDEAACSYHRLLQIKPDFAEGHNNLSTAFLGLLRHEDAIASARQALQINPDLAEAHNSLGNALRGLGRLDEALSSYRRAIEIKPDFVEAHSNLGGTLIDLGRFDDAVSSCRRALEIKPDFADAHSNLGVVLTELGLFDDAVRSYRQAVQLRPDFAESYVNLSGALRRLGCLSEAEAICSRALEIDPQSAQALTLLATLRANYGHFSEAELLFQRASSIDPDLPDAWAGIPQVRKMTPSDAAWLASAQRVVGRPLPSRREIPLRYAIAKYFNDVQDSEQAFINYRRANELTRSLAPEFDRQAQSQATDLTIRTYDRNWLSQMKIHANASARPVFIVGMPRSGTTLAEQILASHPDVFGAGELAFWTRASLAYQSSAHDGQMSATFPSDQAKQYLALLQGLSPDALRVIDKMPGNFWSLGLIHAALPNARIIHMQRNPIDTCLSIYFQHFTVGQLYAHDLQDLAHYYSEYRRTMKHWRSTLPADAILHVVYEDLVADSETWGRKMVEFIGLPWNPQCLDFHQTSRAVLTPSNWQVRQRINSSSIGRWRNYEKFVGPLLHLVKSADSDTSGMIRLS